MALLTRRPLGRPPIQAPPASPITTSPIAQIPLPGSDHIPFSNWFSRARANTILGAWAELRLVPNVHTLRIDDNGNTWASRGASSTVTTAVNNVGIGSLALQQLTSGTNNVAVGRATLFVHTTGNNNLAVGHGALLRSVSCSACIGLGNVAGGTAVDGSAGTYPLIDDQEMILIGTNTGKMSTATRIGGIAIGDTAGVPVKDYVGVIGGPDFTDLMTPGRFYESVSSSSVVDTAGVTLTATQMLSGWIVRSGQSSSVTDTTATAASLVSSGPGVGAPATCRRFSYYNADAADTITIAAGSGVSLSGTMTIPPGVTANFVLIYTNTASGTEAVAIFRVGASQQPNDAGLTSLAALATTGVVVASAADTFITRTITGTANQIDVADGTGVSANPTISLSSAMTLTGKTITGGAFSGGTWDNGAIGATTPAAGTFTAVNSSLAFQLNGNNALVLSGGNHWLRGVDGNNAFRPGSSSSGAWLTISAGSTTRAQINMPASSPKTTPVTGDFWFESTSSALRFRDAGGTTRTITWV